MNYAGGAQGGAVWLSSVTGTFEGCGFTGNAANPRGNNGEGGAIFANAAPSIRNCTFTGNGVRQYNEGAATGRGGAVYMSVAGVFEGNTLTSNSVLNFGPSFGGALSVGGALAMQDCTFASNSVETYY